MPGHAWYEDAPGARHTQRAKLAHHQERQDHLPAELHASNAETAEAAMCNANNVKYYIDVHRPCKRIAHARLCLCLMKNTELAMLSVS